MEARHRPIFALAAAGLLVALVLFGVLGIVLPTREPARFEPPAGSPPRLASKLMLVIVDGLRYDVGTDPARMPRFAEAMQREASGELWAGRVSMTTSAVLTFGTGQRASFEQIVRNIDARPPPFDSWLTAAKEKGLTLMSVGDPAWVQMYGRSLARHRLDPKGVAIDVDFNPITFRDARELRALSPDVLIVHFVTPDHQAHAYSVPSRRYAEHIRGFDTLLFDFLHESGPGWTVVVAGDHGAADSGTHGADVPIQRRSVLFAYGPGIVRGAKASIDQADLAGTFAALLGLPTPAHSRGHVLASFLDLPPEAKRALVCSDAERARGFAVASGLVVPAAAPCAGDGTPAEAARSAVREVDRAFEATSGLSSPAVPWLILGSVLLAGLAAFIAVGRAGAPGIASAAFILAFGVLLTWGVERLPGSTPRTLRIVLFVLGNLPALAALVVPGRLAAFAARAPALSLAIFPGFLIATYTTNAHPEAYVTLAVASVAIVLVGGLTPERPTLLAAKRVLQPAHLALLATCLGLLAFPGTRQSEHFPASFRQNPGLVLTTATVLLGLVALVLSLRSGHRRRVAIGLGLGAAAIASLLARRFVPPIPGRVLLVLFGVAALAFALRRQRLPALLLGLCTYAWVSRDAEIVTLVATLLVADGVGAAFSRHRVLTGGAERPLEPGQLLLVTCFLFGLAFVQRIGVQGALDFGAMDWGVAGFGDPHVPAWVVGGALGLKYLLGLWLVLGAFVSELGTSLTQDVLRAAFLAFLARTAVLAAMFLVAGGSYWTGFRLLGDLPFAMLWLVAAGLAWLAESSRTELARE